MMTGLSGPSPEHSKADGKNDLFRRIKEPQISWIYFEYTLIVAETQLHAYVRTSVPYVRRKKGDCLQKILSLPAAGIADEPERAACMCQRVFTRITPTRSVFHFAVHFGSAPCYGVRMYVRSKLKLF